MKRVYVDTPEGQIYCRTNGSGEPVLLLHKASLSSEEFTEVLPLLGKKYRAIAMDVLGCGNSDQAWVYPANRGLCPQHHSFLGHFEDK